MSLDIDLYAVTYRDGFKVASPEHRETFTKILDLVGLIPFTPVDSVPYVAVKLHVADWNHAYQIWRWFTDHLQDGEASHEEVQVDRETLQELLNLCNRLLIRRNRKEAEAALPMLGGVFKNKAEENTYWRDAYWVDVKKNGSATRPDSRKPQIHGRMGILFTNIADNNT